MFCYSNHKLIRTGYNIRAKVSCVSARGRRRLEETRKDEARKVIFLKTPAKGTHVSESSRGLDLGIFLILFFF